MIDVRKRSFGIGYRYVWFAETPDLLQAIRPVVFAQCRRTTPLLGFVRRSFTTSVVDLSAPAEALLKNMSESGAYNIRRAKRDGVTTREVQTRSEFLDFYAAAAPSVGLGPLTPLEFVGWGEQTIALAADLGGEALVMHCYLIDRQKSRARQLYSVSLHRSLSSKEGRVLTARANRLLHYDAMLLFKSKGLAEFDLGGYAKNSADPRLASIAEFKGSFGGREVREDHFVSLPMYALQTAAKVASGLFKRKEAA